MEKFPRSKGVPISNLVRPDRTHWKSQGLGFVHCGWRELRIKLVFSSLHYHDILSRLPEVDTGELHCSQFHPFRVWRSRIWAGVQLRESTGFGSSTESHGSDCHVLAPCPGGLLVLWKIVEASFRVRSFGKRSLVTSQTQRKLWLISSSVSKRRRSKEAAMALKTQTKSRQTVYFLAQPRQTSAQNHQQERAKFQPVLMLEA